MTSEVAGAGASSSLPFQTDFSAEELQKGIKPHWEYSPDGSMIRRKQTEREIPGLGTFIRDKREKPLGEGTFSIVYSVRCDRDDSTPGRFVLVKLKPKLEFDIKPFKLLAPLPESPFLGGRPYRIFQHLSSKHKKWRFSMIMERLGPDLFTRIESAAITHLAPPLTQWRILVKGLLDGAKGLEVLHQNGLVHRDVKFENISTGIEASSAGGIFDYGTLVRAGEFHPRAGIPLDQLPPEILNTLPSPKTKKILEERNTSRAALIFDRPRSTPTTSTPATPPPCAYFPSFDIFTLGYQFDLLANTFAFNSTPVGVAAFCATLQLTPERCAFINLMQDPDPLKRPSIEEVIAFLEEYNSCINT